MLLLPHTHLTHISSSKIALLVIIAVLLIPPPQIMSGGRLGKGSHLSVDHLKNNESPSLSSTW